MALVFPSESAFPPPSGFPLPLPRPTNPTHTHLRLQPQSALSRHPTHLSLISPSRLASPLSRGLCCVVMMSIPAVSGTGVIEVPKSPSGSATSEHSNQDSSASSNPSNNQNGTNGSFQPKPLRAMLARGAA